MRLSLLLLIAACAASIRADSVTTEICVASALIPSADQVHGETSLLSRDGTACVRTVLHSTSFRRGIREIIAREDAVWTPNKPGYSDSLAYRAALDDVKRVIVDEPRAEADAAKPYTMMMEFTFVPGESHITFFRADVRREADHLVIQSNAVLRALPVSDDYMSRAMLIMTAAALGPERNDAMSLLESAGWRDLSAAVDPSAPAPVR